MILERTCISLNLKFIESEIERGKGKQKREKSENHGKRGEKGGGKKLSKID